MINRLFVLGSFLFLLSSHLFAFDQRDLLVVVEQATSHVTFYNPKNGLADESVKVGFLPHEVIISKDQKTAYVTNFGLQDYDETIGIPGTSISVIDIPSRMEKFRLFTFNPTEKNDFSKIDKAPHGMALRPPLENQLYVNVEKGSKLLIFDVKTRKLIKSFPVDARTHNLVFSPDGKILWLMAGPNGVIRMNAETGEVLGQFKLATPIRGLKYTPDYRYLMVSGSNEIALLHPDNLSIYKQFNSLGVGQILYSDMTLDGKYIIAPAVWDSQVVIIDTATGLVVKRIVTGLDPVTVKLSSSGKFAYVTNARDSYVTEINLDSFQSRNIITGDGPNGIAVTTYIPTSERKTLTIGVALPLSGNDAKYGREMMLGFEFWRLTLRQAGGLNINNQAYDVNIIYLDTQSNKTMVTTQTNNLISLYKVKALFSTYGIEENKIAKDIANTQHIPFIPLPTSDYKTWQPNDIAAGEDWFVTSNEFSKQFQQYYNLPASHVSGSATASGIMLQQALLEANNMDYDTLMKVLNLHSFNTFATATLIPHP